MPKKHTILRLTVKVDMDDKKEMAFMRAMLRRLNILYAKCKPKGALADILNGSILSDAYDGMQKLITNKKEPKTSHNESMKTYHFAMENPKSLPESILEQSVQPPEIAAEISQP